MPNSNITSFSGLLSILVLINGCSKTTGPTSNYWISGAPMPTARHGLAAGVVDEKLYVIGGTNQSDSFNKLEIYDPISDTWSSGTPMPTGRSVPAVGVIDGKLYVAGGYGPSDTYLDILEVYDPESDSWTTGPPMVIKRSGAAAGVLDNLLYVAGGYNPELPDNSSDFLSVLEVYDPASDTWIEKESMLVARRLAAAGVINGKFYVVGGLGESIVGTDTLFHSLNVIEVYDPMSNSWAVKTPMPTERYGPAADVINGHLYVIGGKYRDPENLSYDMSEYNIVEVYNPTNDRWETKASMPTRRKLAAAGVISNRLFVVGGFNWDAFSSLDVLEIFNP